MPETLCGHRHLPHQRIVVLEQRCQSSAAMTRRHQLLVLALSPPEGAPSLRTLRLHAQNGIAALFNTSQSPANLEHAGVLQHDHQCHSSCMQRQPLLIVPP